MVLSGVSICASPNLDNFGVKFDSRLTFEDHVRSIVSRVSQRICILRLMKSVFVNTSLLLRCYYAFVLPILEYYSPVRGSTAEFYLQYPSARCIRWPGFVPIRVSCCCVIDFMLLHCVCCARLIRTRIILCSVSVHLLLSEYDTRAAATAHPIEFEASRCRTSQFERCFLLAQTRAWNDLPYTVFDT